MSNETIAKIGGLTPRIAATSTVTAKAMGIQSKNVIITNNGPSMVFVNTGASTDTLVFPTTTTAQLGSLITAGTTQNFTKNNPTDTTLFAICDAAGTADVLFSSTNGE